MPVSTRSQILSNKDDSTATTQRARSRTHQEDPSPPPRNPHHMLKEKMKALTLLYKQHKAVAALQKTQSQRTEDKRFLSHPSVNLLGSDKEQKEQRPYLAMRENIILPNSTVTRTFMLLPPPNVSIIYEDSKENMAMGGTDRIVGFPRPRKEMDSTTKLVRKLSMGGLGPQSKLRDLGRTKTAQELETVSTKSGIGSRIHVFKC